jgi:2-oxo-4-hydroxy-4-carboxy-5-ureidoimidazoline decarboxylase
MVASTDSALHRFNGLDGAAARTMLLACCASSRWARAVADARPYATLGDLLDAADAACRELSDADVSEALDAHPRIGDKAQGQSTEAQWSRAEQAAVGDGDARTREEISDGNVAYERQFGRVFLIRAAGRSPAEILAELRRRLGNDPETERREVADQLCQITRLRVERLLAP